MWKPRSTKESEAFRFWSHKHGYHFFHEAGYQTADRAYRGVGILVKKGLKTRKVAAWHEKDAQAITVNVQGMNFTCIYISVAGYAPNLQQEVLNFHINAIKGHSWVICGDWNSTPKDSPLAGILVEEGATLLAPTNETGKIIPTRYEGNRCIDYGITNSPKKFGLFSQEDFRVSDHYIQTCQVSLGKNQTIEDVPVVQPVTKYIRPDGISLEDWKRFVQHFWSMSEPMKIDVDPQSVSQRDMDLIWDSFSKKLEGVLRKSVTHANSTLQHTGNDVMLDKFRHDAPWQKNTFRIIKTPVLRGSRKNPGMSFQERKLQHLVSRMAERLKMEKTKKNANHPVFFFGPKNSKMFPRG